MSCQRSTCARSIDLFEWLALQVARQAVCDIQYTRRESRVDFRQWPRAVSSVVEHYTDTVGVDSSNLSPRTILLQNLGQMTYWDVDTTTCCVRMGHLPYLCDAPSVARSRIG